MTDAADAAIAYLRQHADANIQRLCRLLRIASISTQPQRADDCRQAAGLIADYCTAIGVPSRVAETGGHPVVVGSRDDAGPAGPTVLLYGHYDVQPVDPLELWRVPPFEADVRADDLDGRAVDGGVIVARGAADNKGQHMAMLAGVEAVLATAGRLPVNLRVLIEGEEEIGSPNLARFIAERRDELAADVVVLADGESDATGQPTIVWATRGLVYAFVRVDGPTGDLHSGIFGGVVSNPANALCRMLATLHDQTGRVTLEGFYDGVAEPTSRQREELARVPGDEAALARQIGTAALAGGERGRPFNERRWFRPSCDVNGIGSGYQGPGAKTIIPALAEAKVSFRLVGGQDPARVADALRRHLQSHCPADLRVSVEFEHFAQPYQADREGPAFAAMAEAIAQATGRPATWVGGGGTLPILAEFKSILGADSVFLGLARNDCNLHAPNERFNVADFHLGAQVASRFLTAMAGRPVGPTAR